MPAVWTRSWPGFSWISKGEDIDFRELCKQPGLVFFGNAEPLVPEIKLQPVGHTAQSYLDDSPRVRKLDGIADEMEHGALRNSDRPYQGGNPSEIQREGGGNIKFLDISSVRAKIGRALEKGVYT